MSAVDAFRAEVRAFLAEHLPAGWKGTGALSRADRDAFLLDWRVTLQEHGYLAYSWPREYGGGGGTALEEVVVHEECARVGAPVWTFTDHFGIQMIGNTLLHRGSEEQKRHFLPRILTGEDRWCQGYSEPDAGSDLAALRCAAVLDGDEWVINGQKIWTSGAHLSNWIFVLARTEPDQPRHRGISFLLVPMDQPGVEVRPIRTIAGDADFNEVFFSDARTAAHHVVGERGQGWKVAMTLVEFERGAEAGLLYLQFRDELDRLFAQARELGRDRDPVVRQRLAWAYSKVQILRRLGVKAVDDMAAGRSPGAQAAITKIYWSEYHAVLTDLALDVLGPRALTPSGEPSRTMVRADEPGVRNSSASWVDVYLKARSGTIYAGTSEIQRNTIAERILGLPRYTVEF